MADPAGKKKAEIPAWQKSSLSDSSAPVSVAPNAATPGVDEYTLEAARMFLEDETVRSEPRDRKIAYLKEKGLENDVIQSLLGYKQAEDASTIESDLKTVHDSTTKDVPREPTQVETESSVRSMAPRDEKRDAPPIITYPEFLIRPQKPPPLVTAQRLIYAAYVFAGISTLTYGASKFVVQPMLEALTSAREELASTALQDLEKLNAKLENTVSHVPYISSTGQSRTEAQYREDDNISIDSDPTELFHRDVGIQTSPPRSRSSSTASNDRKSKDPATRHASSLSSLLSSLRTLKPHTEDDQSPTADSLRETVTGFQTYLNTLQFSSSAFRTDYNSIYTGATSSDNKKVSKAPGDTDEAAKLKAEIRALKGAFLSSRNFPGRPTLAGVKG